MSCFISSFCLSGDSTHAATNELYFQQDNAPAHRARETVQLLTSETPDFIVPAL